MPSLPGFRDFYPADCAFRNAVFAAWRRVAQRYGFVEYDGPPLEELNLYTKKSGAEIVGQLYNFRDKGEREIALRPEMTPTLARMVTARHKDYKKPMKWFAIPQLFRYERMQRGRLREHFQLNCDIIGEQGLEADIEIIALVIDLLRELGLGEKDFVVRVSDRQFWSDFLHKKFVPEEEYYGIFQAIDKIERESEEKTREKLGDLATPILDILKKGATSERLEYVMRGLAQRGLGNFVKRDLTIVRGLAYYTGIVFEANDRAGALRAICGGGRYDQLLKSLGGVDLPAVGFGMGDVVLGEMLRDKKINPARTNRLEVYVAVVDEKYRPQAMGILQKLRDAGFAADYPLAGTKLGKQLEAAEAAEAKYAVIVDAAIESGQVEIKELATRQQKKVAVAELEKLLVPARAK
jgi:histidyl-tRNA synthetase